MSKDNQAIPGTLDMSSDEPHITLDCVMCGKQWMKKVELNKKLVTSCECAINYIMTTGMHDSVTIELSLTAEQMKVLQSR